MDNLNYVLKLRYSDCTNEKPALHQAVKLNDLETVKLFIECGTDINIVDKYHRLPIAYVWKNSQLEILDLLLAAGSNIYQYDGFGKMQFVKAFQSGHANVIKKYLEYNIDLNQVDYDYESAIYYLMDNNCYEISNDLKKLDFNADVENNLCLTPLWLALNQRNYHWVKLLLEKGADVNYEFYDENTPLNALVSFECDHPNSQHLEEECSTWALRCMELMIENGVEVNRDDYYSILLTTIENNDFEVAKPLLKKFAILEISGTSLTVTNKKAIDESPMAKSYYSYVKAELKRMMELEFKHHKKLSYFDILIEEDINMLAKYFRSLESREDFENNLNQFPYYLKFLKRQFTKAVEREEEISKKEKMLSYLNFPTRFIRKIAIYCFSGDMNVIK